jgi:hypothetical protein
MNFRRRFISCDGLQPVSLTVHNIKFHLIRVPVDCLDRLGFFGRIDFLDSF